VGSTTLLPLLRHRTGVHAKASGLDPEAVYASDDSAPLEVEPFLDDEQRGVFATRAPQRPNPIGLSVVEIDSVTGGTVTVDGIDVVDQTPLLDIKPFVPEFDVPSDADTGWLTATDATVQSQEADEQFL